MTASVSSSLRNSPLASNYSGQPLAYAPLHAGGRMFLERTSWNVVMDDNRGHPCMHLRVVNVVSHHQRSSHPLHLAHRENPRRIEVPG